MEDFFFENHFPTTLAATELLLQEATASVSAKDKDRVKKLAALLQGLREELNEELAARERFRRNMIEFAKRSSIQYHPAPFSAPAAATAAATAASAPATPTVSGRRGGKKGAAGAAAVVVEGPLQIAPYMRGDLLRIRKPPPKKRKKDKAMTLDGAVAKVSSASVPPSASKTAHVVLDEADGSVYVGETINKKRKQK